MKRIKKPVWLIIIALLSVIMIVCLIVFIKLLTDRSAVQGGAEAQSETAARQTAGSSSPDSAEAPKATLPPQAGKNAVVLDAVPLSQDDYPSACEVYAAVTMLNYYGFDIDDSGFIENYLHAEPLSLYDGVYYGPSLYSAFAGTADLGYGVYSPPLESAVNDYLSDSGSALRAKAVTDLSLEELCRACIDKKQPVVIWCTIDMVPVYDYVEWVIDYADDNSGLEVGDIFSWPDPEHCMLLIGYDDENYIFADSLNAEVVAYPKGDCEAAFEELGSQAIYLRETY